MEEAGIAVTDIQYIASQPWPFPSSIMFGFMATAVSEDIQVDKDELDDARWFSRDDLNQFGQWHEQGSHLKLTRQDLFLDSWLSIGATCKLDWNNDDKDK